MKRRMYLLLACMLLSANLASAADNNAPWGHASLEEVAYKPQKVVYDVAVSSVSAFTNVLDRVSYLNTIYQADPFESSIVIVLHGNEIPFFAIKNYPRHKELMARAQSLVNSGNIRFRMCKLAAQGQGFEPGDIHGFVEVVPMADAEIVRLQQEEHHAYMR
ncbi:DsrE family protein [Sulfuriflexus sp.]|uniref:DsrE family protein n=1 Tax=Sulfuriflexus sp. TaxID=2015443 RepID=UPI0028CC1422|nr:DsrE family protein [Sulfuriflexus sp.]MDT8404780.1 DsrE family protein [Sulfuriflexus sp.]